MDEVVVGTFTLCIALHQLVFAMRASIEVADAASCALDTGKAAALLSEVMAEKHSRTHYSNVLHPDDVCRRRESNCN